MAPDGAKVDQSHQAWQPSPLAHRSRDERVAAIQRECFFETNRSEIHWRRARNLMLKPNGVAANAALFLHADAGVGKTELLNHFRDRIDDDRKKALLKGEICLLKPPICFSLEHCSDDLTFVDCLSGGTFKGPKKASEIVKQTKALVEAWNLANSGPLFLDEISDLAKGKPGDQDACCQTLRLVLNRFKGQMFVTGNDDAREAFAADKNLATRFEIVPLSVWGADDDDLRDLLEQCFAVLPLLHAPRFTEADWRALLPLIVNKTGGVTRPMMKFIHRAAIFAIDSHIECMCLKVFQDCDDPKELRALILKEENSK